MSDHALPAIIVRDAATAGLALRLAAPRGALLLSPPGAVEAMGAAWFLAVAAAPAPSVKRAVALDCGAAPGHALAALRLGARIVILAPGIPAFAAVAGAAAELGATLWTAPPPAFDPGRAGLAKPAAQARLTAWLMAR